MGSCFTAEGQAKEYPACSASVVEAGKAEENWE